MLKNQHPVHNRLSSQHQPGPWTYNADNQLQSYGIGSEQHAFTYNPNGHTATEVSSDPATNTRQYTYNAAERLIEITDNGQIIGQYQYDPLGRRIKKQTSEGTTWFLYSDNGLIAELNETGTPTRYFGWKPNGLWGTDPLWLADKTGSSWNVFLYHNDHLWTPQRLTDVEGNTTWQGRAEAFGKTDAITNTIDNPLRFPGQYDDGLSSYYNFARDFDPRRGGFLQRDALGLGAGINEYAYANGSPITWFDPNGQSALCYLKWIFIGAATGAAGGCAVGIAAAAPVVAVAVVGTGGVAALPGGAALGGACAAGAMPGAALGSAVGYATAVLECRDECDDDKCEEQAKKDEQMCRMTTMPRTGARARCWASVQERYGACKAGRPLPPLVVW